MSRRTSGLGTMEGDSSAEMRSMMMVMHPCPPLPIVGGDYGEDNEDLQMSSHDAISFAVDVTSRRLDEAANTAREAAQVAWTEEYMRALRAASAAPYDTMCVFERLYIQAYFPRARMDIRFAPIEDTNQRIHRRVCEWLAAREMVDLGKDTARAEDHYHKDIRQLYAEACSLIISGWVEE